MSQNSEINSIDLLAKVVETNSTISLVLIGIAALVWLVGLNVFTRTHEKRIGKSTHWYAPWKYYNAKEWGIFISLTGVTMALMITALNLT